MLETANPAAAQPAALSWLTNWVSQPMDMAPGFDAEEIKPSPTPPKIVPCDLLEVTVWDLYEPGKPYTFPVRVSDNCKIEIPMLGEVDVITRTIPQVELELVESFRKGEFLLNPRVLVRSLDAPVIKVQVNGAVNRPGYVELARADRSVFAAITSAGGLNKIAGTQVAVTRAALAPSHHHSRESRTVSSVELPTDDSVDSAQLVELYEPHVPTQRANSVEDLSVSPGPPVVRPSSGNRGLYAVFDNGAAGSVGLAETPSDGPAALHTATTSGPSGMGDDRGPDRPVPGTESATIWYDVSMARDRDQLKAVLLAEGDTVTVKAAAQPLRIGGIVNRPGVYPLPPGRSLNAWQAIELAGGVRDEGVPLNITLLRPAAEGRSARRWFLSVASYEQHPANSPLVEPGDELHVEPTTGSKIKRAVRDVWSKP